uniref:AB hydrolase-1 domain-containing protein n=1 Tax=Oryctolagus cuniculus TaxID=9986 RepID=A0A5F9CXJ6_RABIT
MGLLSELKLAVPWGHIAAKAWGSAQGPPVLCLHGWLDNANSFDRLIPLLPQDFHYVAMDFGGHGLSSHYSPGLPYYHQNFVSEIRRVAAALKWNRFSLMGHSFGGTVGGMFSCIFPEMVDKLILLDASPFALDSNELEHLLTYRRRAIEHTLQVEASQKPSRVVSPAEMLQGFLKNNSHVGEECGELLLQRGATRVAAAGAQLRIHQQGAVCARHPEAAGPRPAHQSPARVLRREERERRRQGAAALHAGHAAVHPHRAVPVRGSPRQPLRAHERAPPRGRCHQRLLTELGTPARLQLRQLAPRSKVPAGSDSHGGDWTPSTASRGGDHDGALLGPHPQGPAPSPRAPAERK